MLSSERAPQPAPESPYRLIILVTSWVVLTVTAGLTFFSLPVYLDELSRAPGMPLGTLSVATSFFYVSLGLVSVPVGRMITRFDLRLIMVAGSLVGWLAFMRLGSISTVSQLFIAYGLLGTSFAMVSFVPLTTTVFRWFPRHRSLATTILMCGQAAGGTLVTPVVARLIREGGLAGATSWLAWTYFAAVLVAAVVLLRPHPPRPGTQTGDSTALPADPPDWSAPSADPAAPRFLLLCFAMCLIQCATVGALTHLAVLGTERDISGHTVMVSLFAVASGVGNFVVLPFLRHFRATSVAAALAILQMAAALLLAVASSTPTFAIGSLTLGLGLGAFLVLMPLVLLDLYAHQHFARLYANLTLFANLGVAVGPGALGLLRTFTGGYHLPMVTAAALPGASAYLLWRVFHPRAGASGGCAHNQADDVPRC